MAKSKPQTVNAPKYNTSAATFIRGTLPGGRVITQDGSVLLLRKVPLGPVADAKSIDERMAQFAPLMDAYEELALLGQVSGTRRALVRKGYRQTQVLMVNLKRLFAAPQGHPLSGFLSQGFPNTVTDKRLLIMAVRLNDKVGGGKGGLRGMMESAAETLTVGGSPLSDYDWDTKRVDAALSRCGFTTPTAEEIRIADSWWNHGRHPDVPVLPHAEHLHIFSDSQSVRIADKAGKDDCDVWPHPIPNHRSLTFTSLDSFDFSFEPSDSSRANWAIGLIDDDAVAVSIRAGVEPAKVTRDELRRQRKRYLDDIRERAEQGKMERAEQEEMQATLEDIEAVYARDSGTPTLTDASVLVAFNGIVDDVTQVGNGTAANMRIMQFRQPEALSEMMIGSNVRANPRLHDMPSQLVGASGIQTLATVGDSPAGSALLGLTERDGQPAWVNPGAASAGDAAPIFVNLGATGSGKSLVMLWKAVQYALLNRPQVIVDPKALALDTPIPTPDGWTTMGRIQPGDRVFGRDGQPCLVTHKSRVFSAEETHLYEFVLDDGQVIRADLNHQWVVTTPKDRAALLRGEGAAPETLARFAEAVERLAGQSYGSDFTATGALLTLLVSAGVTRWSSPHEVSSILRRHDVRCDSASKTPSWHLAEGLTVLADHLREEASMGTDRMRVLTTADLLEHGPQTGSGQTYYAIPAPDAVQMPEADLAVDPYLLGAWLGDGTTKAGVISSGRADADEMHGLLQEAWPLPVKRTDDSRGLSTFSFPRDPEQCKRGHRDYVPTVKDSIRCRSCGTGKAEGAITNGSLGDLLAGITVLGDKHIPERYLFSSVQQRLALLQGLMDTDGTVHVKRGELRITLTNHRLIRDVLTLVRSLGIKAHLHEAPAVSVLPGEDGQRIRKVTGTAYTVTFQTDLPVFRLARKGAIQPEASFRSRFSYIREIRPVPAEDAQCIRVDSPDHTYLVGDFVTTHNTGSDHSRIVEYYGGKTYSLDSLKTADGIFDPIRFSAKPEVGVDLAVSMLASIDPWSGQATRFEVPVYNALKYGVDNGATCVGEALQIAFRAGVVSLEVVQPVVELAKSSPLFRACVGFNRENVGLRLAESITYIKVGDTHLDLPEPGAIASATLMQRVSMALVRMMVFGSAMALTGRGGAIHLDEAWVFLGAGKTEVERLGRLARSQNVLPELYTQRATDPLQAGLAGYISRGLILPIEDADEARAALQLFKLEPTAERMERITAKATKSNGQSVAPNWKSMRALRDPNDKTKTLRGTIGIYSDLAGRAVPVEIKLPPEFLAMASTNPEDIARRERLEAQRSRAA